MGRLNAKEEGRLRDGAKEGEVIKQKANKYRHRQQAVIARGKVVVGPRRWAGGWWECKDT